MVCSLDNSDLPASTKTEGKDEFCVTVSPQKEKVSFDKWGVKEILGRDLINIIPENIAILISTSEVGRYLTPRKIKSLKLLLNETL